MVFEKGGLYMSEAIELRDDVLRIERINGSQNTLFDNEAAIYDNHSTQNSISENRFYRISSVAGETIYDSSGVLFKDGSAKLTSKSDIEYVQQVISTDSSIKILPEDYLDGEVETVNLSQKMPDVIPTKPQRERPHNTKTVQKPVTMQQTAAPAKANKAVPAKPVQTAKPAQPQQNYSQPVYTQPVINVQPQAGIVQQAPPNTYADNRSVYTQRPDEQLNEQQSKVKLMSALAFILALIALLSFISGISSLFAVASIMVALTAMKSIPKNRRTFMYITIVIAVMSMFLNVVIFFLI